MMFEIPSTNVFYMQEDEFPTIHFIDDIMDINCSFRIDKPEWVNNLKEEKKCNKESIEWIVEYLKEKDSEFPEITHYELSRRIWNINHQDNRVENKNIPNYIEM